MGFKRKRTVHGHSKKSGESSEYRSYRAAKARCENPKNNRYFAYGARGIEFRFENFVEFYSELGPKPKPTRNYSVNRINNNGHYEKGNVHWATRSEQMKNRRMYSADALRNMSEAQKGKKHSPEHCAKISAGLLAAWKRSPRNSGSQKDN